jgi:hypothetical protein
MHLDLEGRSVAGSRHPLAVLRAEGHQCQAGRLVTPLAWTVIVCLIWQGSRNETTHFATRDGSKSAFSSPLATGGFDASRTTCRVMNGLPAFSPSHLVDFGATWARANALADTCEEDFRTLQKWFGVPGGFGPSNKVTITIDPSLTGLGRNFGYFDDGTTKITMLRFTTTKNADAAARAVFVAEMSEIFMDYRTVDRRRILTPARSQDSRLPRVAREISSLTSYTSKVFRDQQLQRERV